jgi:hypothetical protein
MAELIALSSESDSGEEMDMLISHIKTTEVGMEKRVYKNEKNSW